MNGVGERHEVSGHLGQSNSKIDEKGRIVLGEDRAKFLEGGHVLVRGDLGCLEIYPIANWEKRIAEFNDCPDWVQGKQVYRTFVMGTADSTVKMDEGGRLVVPLALREKCRLCDPVNKGPREIVFVGNGLCIQVWSKEDHESFEDNPFGFDEKRAGIIAQAIEKMRPHLKQEATTK
jgi:division/cell wall cluster transcriptional repressor MraZ